MKIGVSGRIDVLKLLKQYFFTGAKGTYMDFQTFIEVDVQDQYGNNGFITQELGKESRDRGEKGPILGNVKVFWNDAGQQQAPQQNYQQAPQQAPQQQRQAPQQQQQQQQQQYQQERQQPPAQYQQSPNQNVPQANDFNDDQIPF